MQYHFSRLTVAQSRSCFSYSNAPVVLVILNFYDDRIVEIWLVEICLIFVASFLKQSCGISWSPDDGVPEIRLKKS